MSQAREQQFITEVRAANRAIWNGINALVAAKVEWNALDYGNTLDDGTDQNLGITKAEIGPIVFAVADALVQVIEGSGGSVVVGSQAGNMAKVL